MDNISELKSIPDTFHKVVAEYPNKIALIYQKREMSYLELWEYATRLAIVLQKNGVKKGSIIALKVERNLELYVFMLAILQAGAIIIPINRLNPKSYIDDVLTEVKADYFISEEASEHTTHPCSILLNTHLLEHSQEGSLPQHIFPTLSPDDPAIMLMTSGSTGTPKSVVVRHRGITRLSLPVEQLGNSDKDCFLQLADFSFAASANEIWMSLLTGATLVITPGGLPDMSALEQLIKMHRITVLFLSSGLFRLFVEIAVETLHIPKCVVISGDFVNLHLFMQAARSGTAKIFNGLGCTENSAISSLYQVKPYEHFSSTYPVPVGTPLPLVEMVVLDEKQKPCLSGKQGELYISGAGLALGYTDPTLTKSRFITLQYKGELKRFYRTDDQAIADDDHNIILIGRGSQICKIRGYRVDISGVEHVLRLHPAIEDVLIIPEETSEELRLNACFISKKPLLSNVDLVSFLQHRLPGWMIPEKFTQLPSLPMTSNGKRDRLQLKKNLLERI